MDRDEIRVLCLGDIVGQTGREIVVSKLPQLKSEYKIDFVVANGENSAGGFGITRDIAQEFFSVGIDAITSGNHIWKNKDIFAFIHEERRLVRPFNYPEGTPGFGYAFFNFFNRKIAILNLLGRTYMDAVDCPFRRGEHALKRIFEQTNIILVDFHAEATAEKRALGFHFDGDVSLVYGTHTHVQTADECILPGGTAYITDVGMCGAEDSVIGIKKDPAIKRFVTQLPHKFEVAAESPMVNGIVVAINLDSGKAHSIKRVFLRSQ